MDAQHVTSTLFASPCRTSHGGARDHRWDCPAPPWLPLHFTRVIAASRSSLSDKKSAATCAGVRRARSYRFSGCVGDLSVHAAAWLTCELLPPPPSAYHPGPQPRQLERLSPQRLSLVSHRRRGKASAAARPPRSSRQRSLRRRCSLIGRWSAWRRSSPSQPPPTRTAPTSCATCALCRTFKTPPPRRRCSASGGWAARVFRAVARVARSNACRVSPLRCRAPTRFLRSRAWFPSNRWTSRVRPSMWCRPVKAVAWRRHRGASRPTRGQLQSLLWRRGNTWVAAAP